MNKTKTLFLAIPMLILWLGRGIHIAYYCWLDWLIGNWEGNNKC